MEYPPIKITFGRRNVDKEKDVANALQSLVKGIYESVSGLPYEGNFNKEIEDLSIILSIEEFEA